jgi:hypothetical protein
MRLEIHTVVGQAVAVDLDTEKYHKYLGETWLTGWLAPDWGTYDIGFSTTIQSDPSLQQDRQRLQGSP